MRRICTLIYANFAEITGFPSTYSGLRKITVGAWRTPEAGPMQVVSGPMGRERIHFEAPSAERLEHEMTIFLD